MNTLEFAKKIAEKDEEIDEKMAESIYNSIMEVYFTDDMFRIPVPSAKKLRLMRIAKYFGDKALEMETD